MNHMECLQYGVAQGLHKKEGWLWDCLCCKQATNKEKKAQREYLKAQFKVLLADIMGMYDNVEEAIDTQCQQRVGLQSIREG